MLIACTFLISGVSLGDGNHRIIPSQFRADEVAGPSSRRQSMQVLRHCLVTEPRRVMAEKKGGSIISLAASERASGVTNRHAPFCMVQCAAVLSHTTNAHNVDLMQNLLLKASPVSSLRFSPASRRAISTTPIRSANPVRLEALLTVGGNLSLCDVTIAWILRCNAQAGDLWERMTKLSFIRCGDQPSRAVQWALMWRP
jgi:hypothetical protein